MSNTFAVALIAIGAVLAILGILQHAAIIQVHIDHLALVLIAVGLIAIVAGVIGFVMRGRSSAPLA